MWIGIIRIFTAIKNVTLDGERPIIEYFHLFDETAKLYVASAILTTLTIFLARRRTVIVFLFIAGSAFWSSYVISALSSGLDCTYWHQGDVLCSDLSTPTWTLFMLINATNILLGFSLIWHKTKTYKLTVGMLLSAVQNFALLFAFMNV